MEGQRLACPRKKSVNVHEAKTHLSRLEKRVMAGEEIVIAKANTPVARLVPYDKAPAARQAGTARGEITLAADFLDPLPEDVLGEFEA